MMTRTEGITKSTQHKAGLKSALRKRWFALWPITLALILYPVSNLFTRIATLCAFAGLYSGLLYFCWDKRVIRFAALIGGGLFALFLLLPAREAQTNRLRRRYVDSLGAYNGTRYIWGGENRIGMDCSGLMRSGLIVAEYKEGILALNPGLVREGFSLWWNDCSARALGEEFQHRTKRLFSSPSINELDHAKILPGDFAVTADGVHVLAYTGEKTWIEADPGERKVIKVQVPSPNPWFNEPVNIMRWALLDESEK